MIVAIVSAHRKFHRWGNPLSATAHSFMLGSGHTGEPCKTAEPIEMLFGRQTRMGLRNHVWGRGVHCRYLMNTTEGFVHGGDAILCQITLTTCFVSRHTS